MNKFLQLAAASVLALAQPALAENIRVISYNVESDNDTSATEVSKDIVEIGAADIWGLQEVSGLQDMFAFREAMSANGRDMWFELGLSGGSDRLAIVYDRSKFDVVEGPEELQSVGGSRPPLWMRLADKASGQTINVIVNHLNRGNEELRRRQASGLRDWISETDEATIILGDFNFDLEVPSWSDSGILRGNRAFHIFTKLPSPSIWVQHDPKISTQCSTTYDSVLDFVFLSGAARGWEAETELLFTEDEYCEDEASGGADHRPIALRLDIPDATAPAENSDTQIMEEIARLREQLDALERSLQSR